MIYILKKTNITGTEYKVIFGDYDSVQEILTEEQLKNLKLYQNTVINKDIVDQVGEYNLIREVKNGYGYETRVKKLGSGSCILELIPHYEVFIEDYQHIGFYTLYNNGRLIRLFDKCKFTKDHIKSYMNATYPEGFKFKELRR